jgi:glycogen operon protein
LILGGDEAARTQQGNNNAYCQDIEISWVNWVRDERAEELIAFVRRLSSLRNRFPVLRQRRFLTGAWNEEMGVKDATWLTPAGTEMAAEHWHDAEGRCVGLLLDGRAQTSGIRRRGGEATLLLITNAHHDVIVFTLPKASGGREWVRLVDTNVPGEDDDYDAPRFKFRHEYEVTGQSLLLFLLRRPRRGRTARDKAEKPDNPLDLARQR